MNEQIIDKLLNAGIMPIPDYAKPKLWSFHNNQ